MGTCRRRSTQTFALARVCSPSSWWAHGRGGRGPDQQPGRLPQRLRRHRHGGPVRRGASALHEASTPASPRTCGTTSSSGSTRAWAWTGACRRAWWSARSPTTCSQGVQGRTAQGEQREPLLTKDLREAQRVISELRVGQLAPVARWTNRSSTTCGCAPTSRWAA